MASGYDISSRHSFRLMQGRLGTYDKMPYDANKIDPAIKGLTEQQKRLMVHGGNRQQERMIKDKRRSLDHAVYFSYQGADVVRVDAENKQPVKALINPNKLKQDYDDKIISVGYEYKFKCGDVFEWLGTNTHWIIYLQDLTELAYFRGDIRKCSHEIAWEDDEGYHKTYAAIRGPVETKINYLQKHGISLDTPNLSLNILMPKTEEAMKYFKRYSKFYLSGSDICWRVEALDWLSMPGILEINAVEYYSNEHEDDVENGIVGGLIVEPANPNPPEIENIIKGETFIKPKKTYEFTFSGSIDGDWYVDKKYPVEFIEKDNNRVVLKWNSSYSGQFSLFYGELEKTIVIESLF